MKPRRIIFLSLLFLAGLFPVTTAAAKAVITIPPAVEVAGEELFLGELGEITADSDQREKIARIHLGRAPRYGETSWLYRTNVLYALDRSELKGAYILEMPDKVRVNRASQLLTAELILEAVERYIGEQASPYWTNWRVEPGRLQERRVPKGKLEIGFEGEQTPLKPGLNTFRLKVAVDGEVFITLPVTVRLTIEAPVYVSTQKLNRYTELTTDSLRREVQTLATGKEWLAPLQVEAYWLIRDLPAGKVLMVGDLQEKPLVTKGSKIRLTLESGPIQVVLSVQAEENGWLGDRITVTNLGSNQQFMATVIGPGMVEVNLE